MRGCLEGAADGRRRAQKVEGCLEGGRRRPQKDADGRGRVRKERDGLMKGARMGIALVGGLG